MKNLKGGASYKSLRASAIDKDHDFFVSNRYPLTTDACFPFLFNAL
jgi:hypothetical protein